MMNIELFYYDFSIVIVSLQLFLIIFMKIYLILLFIFIFFIYIAKKIVLQRYSFFLVLIHTCQIV